MKIICTKSDLVHAVSIVSKAVSNNTTLPILKCILIEASTGNIKLTANDMELGIQTEISGDIIDRGMIDRFISLVKLQLKQNFFLKSLENYRIMT